MDYGASYSGKRWRTDGLTGALRERPSTRPVFHSESESSDYHELVGFAAQFPMQAPTRERTDGD